MTESNKVSLELDRMITLGHQDSSLLIALQRKFPTLTEAELLAGFEKATADRSLKTDPEGSCGGRNFLIGEKRHATKEIALAHAIQASHASPQIMALD